MTSKRGSGPHESSDSQRRKLTDAEREIADARERIASLEQDLAASRRKIAQIENAQFAASAGGMPTFVSRQADPTMAIRGLKQFAMRVDGENRIVSLNHYTAESLGKRVEDIRGKDVRAADNFGFGPGFLRHTIDDVRDNGKPQMVIKEEFLPPSPNDPAFRAGAPSVRKWRIMFTPIADGFVDVVIEDVTRELLIEEMLGRFISPEVAQALLDRGKELEILPARRHITSLFCDLREFSTFANGAEERDVRDILNDFFSRMVDAVSVERGIVNKFLGDGLLAIFGAPLMEHDHAVNCLYAAFAMLDHHARLQKEWKSKGFAVPGLAIGLVSGKAVVGVLGSVRHQDYTAIGRYVNLAKRLCDAAPAGEVHMPRTTYDHIKDVAERHPCPRASSFRGLELGNREFKGFKNLVSVVRAVPAPWPPPPPA